MIRHSAHIMDPFVVGVSRYSTCVVTISPVLWSRWWSSY